MWFDSYLLIHLSHTSSFMCTYYLWNLLSDWISGKDEDFYEDTDKNYNNNNNNKEDSKPFTPAEQ